MVIEFGRWRLVPVDKLNWELCHRHAATRGKNEGEESWHRLGRYYSYSTLGNALWYAADQELREKDGDAAAGIMDALAEYRAITDALMADMARALGEGEE